MNNRKGWIITLVGALFFFYAFLQTNLMASLHEAIHNHFTIGPKEIGMLSSIFFYANILFIIPAGLLLDRFSIRRLMSVNMMLVIIGTLIFAFADNLLMAGIGRFFSGIMMAFGLVICIKLASLWIPSYRMALASSLIITIGMLGAVMAQAPLTVFVLYYGWRVALLLVTALGIVIMSVLWAVVRQPEKEEKSQPNNILISLWQVIKEKQNWISGFFVCCLNLPIALFGALFGIVFLMHVYSLSPMMAAFITSMLFWGMFIGSPFFGWLSDRLHRRKPPMFIGSILCFFCMLIILYLPNLGIVGLHLLFFATGFTSAAQVVAYPVIVESNPQKRTATGLSLAAIVIIGIGYGLRLQLMGALLQWNEQMRTILPYQKTFAVIPIGIAIGIIILFFMKETFCRPIDKVVLDQRK